MTWPYSSDWTDADVDNYVPLCRRVQVHPLHLLACMFNESNARADARNPGDVTKKAVAVGLIQFTKAALPNYDLDALRMQPVATQLPMVEHYLAPHMGRMTSTSLTYLALFLPACLTWPGLVDTTVITSLHGPLSFAYLPNRSFDHDGKGFITLHDLGAAANRAATGKRWTELSSRVLEAMQSADTDPEIIREETRETDLGDGDGTLSEEFHNDDEPPPEAA
jgi:hypothetical protein